MAVEFCFCLDNCIQFLNQLSSSESDSSNLHNVFVKNKVKDGKERQNLKKWNASDRKAVLQELSNLILKPRYTLELSARCTPLLLQLLYGAADIVRGSFELHQQFCVALAKIVFVYPQCISFAIQYLSSYKPFGENESSTYEPPHKKPCKKPTKGSKISALEICRSSLLLLLSDRKRFSEISDWSNVLRHVSSGCPKTKWYALQVSSIVTNTSARSKKLLLDRHFSQSEQSTLSSEQLNWERELKNSVLTVDGADLIIQSNDGGCVITNRDLHPSLIAVCGILIPKLTPTATQTSTPLAAGLNTDSPIIVVPSTVAALQHVAMAVSCEKPVLLSGHIGAGKTCLVEHLARLTGRYHQLIKVQLGEQIDSRSLLGTYCCTETPGEFVWRPGPLSLAVEEGKWLLLEDIDIAPMDVISLLLSLVETGRLQATNKCSNNKIKPGFQLFMTKRLQHAGFSSQSNCSILEKAVATVTIEPLSRTELTTIVNTLHPNLVKVTDRLLDMYFTLTSGKHTDDRADVADTEMMKFSTYFGSRQLSTRDLLRWCSRISGDFQLHSSQNEIFVFQEALDCFCDSLTKLSQRVKLAEAIGTKINVPAEKAEYFCVMYKPTIDMSKEVMKVGRASLARKAISAADSLSRRSKGNFAFTRQSSALLEKIVVSINHSEPVLLVGETGTGKTSVVQYLAEQTGRKLMVINMNQQSDTTDLLGGYKPIMISMIISPLRQEFECLFSESFSRKQNQKFLNHIQQCYSAKRWPDLLKLMEHTVKAALKRDAESGKWKELQKQLHVVKRQVKYAESALAFSFVEGVLVKALKEGHWVLLDEINLATAETLDCLCGILDTAEGSVTLVDRGDTAPVYRHPEFRLFACMNPATDVGKKDLTPGVRSRFTEFFVDELESKADLRVMVSAYLGGLSLDSKQIDGIVNFYLAVKQEAANKLTDGTGKRPTYSLRTLCRALRYAASNPYQAVQRSLYESFSMSFLTQVDRSSHPLVTKLIIQHIIGNRKSQSILSKPLLPPINVQCEKFEGYWLKRGQNEPIEDEKYILTDTVRANMKDVARVVACGEHPVLLQGETSVGKTSMIEYIAKASGNKCVRINNHEHTDVQEYTGSYVADENGHLVFKEGILVDAMRRGYWIILDELNLAPTDVLEALNRLLDDNRELFIAETQQTVKAHPSFILFATQNPPGLYGGRKMLSRAFRNRFVELHFDEIPHNELEFILHKRCSLPLSSCKKMIRVMSELQVRRRDSGLFAGKQGYITLRDVFRWGERYRLSAAEITDTFYNWDQLLADQGFMLLAGRVRKEEEEILIAQVLEKHFKCKVDPREIYSVNSSYGKELSGLMAGKDSSQMFGHIVWTYSLTRLAVLVGQSIKFNEPVLMIGDTGCGKTTICQYFAHIYQRELHTINCHMHTEGSHFLGGLRPVRHSEMETDNDGRGGKLFEWQDGPLVISMRSGSILLVDEISLADDSVLERLNSVLEPSRTLVLAEKGGELEIIKADTNFRLVATMNPSGDYGKKELSPALRNRFTEIWCPQSKDINDYKLIVDHNIACDPILTTPSGDKLAYSQLIVQFVEWFRNQDFGRRFTISIRDILAWVDFINKCHTSVDSLTEGRLSSQDSYIHGACLVFLDALDSASGKVDTSAEESCLSFLQKQLGISSPQAQPISQQVTVGETEFSIGPFSIPLGDEDRALTGYTLQAPSTSANCLRLLRGLQLHKPILLEGSPGVGKTSLVTALAKASGHRIVRINLSQQTDIADLFGADLPVEGGLAGQFSWRDGLFLQALKAGHWVVLDELNLASQSVLEGLNACFDHRAEVFVPELSKTFHIQHEKVKIFACQNPLKQGGGRQGLPQSFLNRFTQVYVSEMESKDQEFITCSMYPDIPRDLVKQMVLIITQMIDAGLPGEYNLRDIFRWCDLIKRQQVEGSYNLQEHFSLLFIQALRVSSVYCETAYSIFEKVTGSEARHSHETERRFHLTDSHLVIGNMIMERRDNQSMEGNQACILHKQLPGLEYLATCMHMGWMAILDGPECSGKSTVAHVLSSLVGEDLKIFTMNSAMDTTDLLGGFEQADVSRSLDKLCDEIATHLSPKVSQLLISNSQLCLTLMSHMHSLRTQSTFSQKLSVVENLLSFTQSNHVASAAELSEWQTSLQLLKKRVTHEGVSTNGSFEWVDSVLVEAVTRGHWLLVENAHICSASVLDRLNSLLEPNGSLTITERGVLDGQPVVIRPHANFRLILTTNMQLSDLSRAMKNRGVVISMLPASDIEVQPADDQLYDLIGLSPSLREVFRREHSELWSGRRQLSNQILYERVKLFLSYYQRGFSVEQSVHSSRRLYLYHCEHLPESMESLPADVISHMSHRNQPWSVDALCRTPSLAMADILVQCINMATSTTLAKNTKDVADILNAGLRLLMEKLSVTQLLHYVPVVVQFLSDNFSSRYQGLLMELVSSAKPLLQFINQLYAENSLHHLADLPINLRWMQELCSKLPVHVQHTLSCLLNAWSILMHVLQMLTDLKYLPVNSWLNISSLVDRGQRDKKHLPHKVALYYPKLAKNFLELVERVGNSADTCQQVEDQQLKQILHTSELVRRFLSCSCLVSSTLCWSWLKPALSQLPPGLSAEELSSTVAHIDKLLKEHNIESHLFNLIWKSFPHHQPIDCQVPRTQPISNETEQPIVCHLNKSQLAIILQKTLDSFSVYNKPLVTDSSKGTSLLPYMDMQKTVSVLVRASSFLYYGVEADSNLPELMMELSSSTSVDEKSSTTKPYAASLWPLQEFWLLRAVLLYLSADTPSEHLQHLSSYTTCPGVLRLSLSLSLLHQHQNSNASLLNMMSQWFSFMTKASPFRLGEPFIQSHCLTSQAGPSFDSFSMFLIISRLLADPLGPSSQLIFETADGTHPTSITPPVSLGKYKLKLNQLNDVCRELWDKAILLNCETVRADERAFQCRYNSLILDSTWIPEELKSHPTVLPVINQLMVHRLNSAADWTEVKVAEQWVWLGLLQALATAPRGLLDPVVKQATELDFASEEMGRLDREMQLRDAVVMAECGQKLSPHWSHPHYAYVQGRLQKLTQACAELAEGSVQRPRNEQFQAIVADVKKLLSNTLNYENLLSVVTGLQDPHNRNAVAREQLVNASLESYISNMESCYPLYIDVCQPHVNALHMIIYGLKRLTFLRASRTPVPLTNNLSTPAQLFNSLQDSNSGVQLIQEACETTSLDSSRTAALCCQYLRLHALSLRNEAHNSTRLDRELMSKLCTLMKQYVAMWQSDNAKKAEKEAEATSLYSFKQHGEEPETDDELIEKLTKQSFPSFHQEFSDLVQADTLGDSVEPEAKVDDSQATSLSITEQDMENISQLHCSVMLSLANTDWYKGEGHYSLNTDRKNTHTILLNLLHEIISSNNGNHRLDNSLSEKLSHLHIISAGTLSAECQGRLISQSDSGNVGQSEYDIYQDENVAQAVRCMEPLTVVRARIQELLSDWPEHPLLTQIVSIIERVESFLVTDPLMKITSGLELILEKLQEWETNAAKYVSVQSAMNSVSQLIIEWRKLELDGWKNSLDNVFNKIRKKSTKYWFHLCSTLLPALEKDGEVDSLSVRDVLSSLINFMESASLGDFCYRLHLLKAFTVHIGVVSLSQDSQLLNSMYCIWKFYFQFEATVADHIKKKRSAIEKELKNFVKISRWHDMNFWSVRASVDKAHKTIAKQMKAYHDILISAASKLFTEDVSQLPTVTEMESEEGETELSGVSTTVDAVTSTAASTSTSYSPVLIDSTDSLQCLPRLAHLITKFRAASVIIISKLDDFSGACQSVDDFTREIIIGANELQGLTIISGEDKEKQKRQARNIDMKKRNSLSLLLKTLHRIGLSYRKGSFRLQKSQDRNDLLFNCNSAPLNLEKSLRPSDSKVDKHWAELCSSTNKYILRCITRRSVLLEAAGKPSKELGVDIVHKLRGYSEHMMDLMRRHECLVTSHTLHWLRLREQVVALSRLCNEQQVPSSQQVTSSQQMPSSQQVPSSTDTHSVVTEISSTVPGIIEHVEELKMLLLSAPASTDSPLNSPISADLTTPVCGITLYSEKWQTMVSSIDSVLSTLHTSCERLSTFHARSVILYTDEDTSLVLQIISQLGDCTKLVDSVISNFKSSSGRIVLVSAHHAAFSTFTQLLVKSESSLLPSQRPCSSFSTSQFTSAADELVKGVLLACQHTIATLEKVPKLDDDVESLADKQVTTSLTLIDEAIKNASIDSIVGHLSTLTADIAGDVDAQSRKYKVQLLAGCLQMFELFTTASRQLLTRCWSALRKYLKLLSVLYNIFTHLASKGFCLPEELSDEMEGEGQGDFTTSEGAGLADGQGAKDVSDQIENEAELDDAKRQEDRDKEEDTTPEDAPPQEDNAIEMSDDFDGAMEDAPATEVDEEDENASSGDEDEMDDQMGDIGNSELNEKLDDKLWGDDDKSDEQDNQESKEEEEGKGSGETEQEMVAKDENPAESSSDDKQAEKQPDTEQEKELNELDKEEGEEYDKNEQPDPYFGEDANKQDENEEQDGFDLPEDLDLDEGEEKAGEDEINEEPMDVDDEGHEGEESQENEIEETNPEDEVDKEESGQVEEQDIPEINPDEVNKEDQKVESCGASSQTADDQIIEQTAQDRGGETESKEEQGTGQSESSLQKEAGLGDSYQTGSADNAEDNERHQSMECNSNNTDDKRVLGDTEDKVTRQLDTIQSTKDRQAPAKQQQTNPSSNSLYEHITAEEEETADAQTMDAANEQEVEEQQKDDGMESEQTDNLPAQETPAKQKIEETMKLSAKEMSDKLSKSKERQETDTTEKMEEDGDDLNAETEDVEQEVDERALNRDSTIHTDMELLRLSHQELSEIKQDLEQRVADWGSQTSFELSESEARKAWEKYDAVTKSTSHELCEQLRLILEPTQVAKLKGDYRTGKRLNMRKVITYIASQFRKDAIWLRRTEPSKREYQIAIAVDDSSSMLDNHSKQLAFEALACISNALTYLQAGEMSIVSFGEDVKMIHDFSSNFSWNDGGNVLRSFSFNQKKTKIAHMLNTMCSKFQTMRRTGSTSGRHQLAQLLMVVSDGRGLFLEGVEKVKQAVRMAISSGIFLVFVVIDNPHGKDSILDIKMPVFSGSGVPQIKSYMDSFPFPFYVILRDIDSLPTTLGDALRQWFELVTSQT